MHHMHTPSQPLRLLHDVFSQSQSDMFQMYSYSSPPGFTQVNTDLIMVRLIPDEMVHPFA